MDRAGAPASGTKRTPGRGTSETGPDTSATPSPAATRVSGIGVLVA